MSIRVGYNYLSSDLPQAQTHFNMEHGDETVVNEPLSDEPCLNIISIRIKNGMYEYVAKNILHCVNVFLTEL